MCARTWPRAVVDGLDAEVGDALSDIWEWNHNDEDTHLAARVGDNWEDSSRCIDPTHVALGSFELSLHDPLA